MWESQWYRNIAKYYSIPFYSRLKNSFLRTSIPLVWYTNPKTRLSVVLILLQPSYNANTNQTTTNITLGMVDQTSTPYTNKELLFKLKSANEQLTTTYNYYLVPHTFHPTLLNNVSGI